MNNWIRKDNGKNPYEHHVYESVEDKSISKAISQNLMVKLIRKQMG